MKIKDLKVGVLFSASAPSGDVFYRMIQPIKAMEKMGIKVYSPKYDPKKTHQDNWEYDLSGDAGTFTLGHIEGFAKKCDILIFQKVISDMGLALLMMLKDKYKKPILFEIDDDAFNVDPSHISYNAYLPDSPYIYWMKKQLELSDGVITSTQDLKEKYGEYNKNVFIVPNAIDKDIWGKLNNKKVKKIRIGWEGAGMHRKDLRMIVNVIPKILKKYKDVEFYFWGVGLPNQLLEMKSNRVKIDEKFVTIDKYPKTLASKGFTIGIAPLFDNEFNRAKSPLRWQEYSALKIPTVVSRVRAYDVVEDGKTGFVAQEENEWYMQMSKLIESEVLRNTIADNAYNKVMAEYSIRRMGLDFFSIINNYKKIEVRR